VLLAFAAFIGRADVDTLSTRGKLLLGVGTTGAVAAMAVVTWFPVRRVVGTIPLRVSFTDPFVRRFARLSSWAALYVWTSQLETIVTYALAYGTQGGATAYTTALAFFQLPYAVLAASVMTVLVPQLSQRASDDDIEGFCERVEYGMSVTLAAIIPAGFAYAAVAHPVMRVLLQRGQVTAQSADYVARLVQIFTVGLVGYSLWLLFLRAFYALQDARSPAFVNFAVTGVFVGLDFTLYPLWKVEGQAWVHAIGYSIAAYLAGRALDRRLGGLDWDYVVAGAIRVTGAAAVMGAVMYAVVRALEDPWRGLLGQTAVVSIALAVGGAVMAALAVLLDIDEVRDLRRLVRRRQ
jgi:putative peptidoglycan lipid II flippase